MSETLSNQDFARLLAAERITVNIGGNGASFNTKTRVLNLPNWSDNAPIRDAMIVHEVGHALHTPVEAIDSIKSLAKSSGQSEDTVKWYMNVLEDARIDRKMIREYPGAAKDYTKAFEDLLDRGVFGDISKVNSMPLIDRINLHFKLGKFTGLQVPFTIDEARLVDRISKAESFDQIKSLTKKVLSMDPYPRSGEMASMMDFDMSGDLDADSDQDDNQENESNDGPTQAEDGEAGENRSPSNDQGDQGDESDSSSNGSGDGDQQDQNNGASGSGHGQPGDQSPADGKSENQAGAANSSSGSTKHNGPGQGKSSGPLPMPQTQIAMNREAAKSVVPGSSQVTPVRVQVDRSRVDTKYRSFKVPYTEFLKEKQFATERGNNARIMEFRASYKNTISMMAQRFEMKKAADMSKRVQISKTGVIDTLKMNSYKWNDDIFRKNSTVKEGKSHGIVVVIDWSGSMSCRMRGTLYQAVLIAEFCRRVRIPFEIYGFSDNHTKAFSCPLWSMFKAESGNCSTGGTIAMMELLSSKMKPNEYTGAVNSILAMANGRMSGNFGLGGTPLGEALVCSRELILDFKTKHRVQSPHCVFLTDGEGYTYMGLPQSSNWNDTISYELSDPEFGYYDRCAPSPWSSHVMGQHNGAIIRWARATTGATYTNFYLDGRSASNKESCVAIPYDHNEGWNQEYHITSKSMLADSNISDQQWANDPTGMTLIKKSAESESARKKVLQKFVDMICGEIDAETKKLMKLR